MCCCGVCPQWPDRCCLCFSRKGGVILTGLLSILDNICIIVACVYSSIRPAYWDKGYVEVEHWIITNKWDYIVANKAVILLQNIHEHRIKFLIGIAGYSGVAIICGILLIVSVSIKCKGESSNKTRRQFMLPWLCFDFLTISIITLTFVTWAFLSFFVHILLAILFPVIAGAILGLYIYLWRNVREVYEMYGDEHMKTASSGKLIHVNTSSGGIHYSSSKMYRKLPAAASSPHSVNSHPSVLSGNRHIAVT